MVDKNDKIEYVSEDSDEPDKKVKKVKHQLKHCEQERGEYLAGWQRAKADYINLEKRVEQEKSEWIKFANSGLICELLLILDSLEAAIRHLEQNEKTATAKTQNEQNRKTFASLRRGEAEFSDSAVPREILGIQQIYNQLMDTLKRCGLEPIKSLGEKFNPELHEVVEEKESDKEKGLIVEEIQKGYKLHGKIIRHSKVKINKL